MIKKDCCGCVYPKSYDFIHLWFKQKGLRYLDLTFDFFERLILPSVLRKFFIQKVGEVLKAFFPYPTYLKRVY